jgi:hypothetical protein
MAETRFARLTRALVQHHSSRRRLLAGLASLAALVSPGSAIPSLDGAARRRKKHHRRKHHHGGGGGGPGTPPPSCTDGIQNGSETDVDCGGGTCPRCGIDKTCRSRDDCASALCLEIDGSNVCGACAFAADCGVDADGSMCACRDNAANERVCTKINGRFIPDGTCADCRAGEQCTLLPGGAECLLPCGVPDA